MFSVTSQLTTNLKTNLSGATVMWYDMLQHIHICYN